MATTVASVSEICLGAKRASRHLATVDTLTKNRALNHIADALEARVDEILEANRLDVADGRNANLTATLLDRLTLDRHRVHAMAEGVRSIAGLHDPVGEVIDGHRLANGLDVRKVRVPLGVIAVVYEARPNVTIDAAALCLKSGNAVVLRGSSSASRSNAILATVASEAAVGAGLPDGTISLVGGGDRSELTELATQTGVVDLIIPRGGEGLKHALSSVATVPVIYAASGNCHVYVDASADLRVAQDIVINAKVQRPGVCNAAETLLVHRHVAAEFLPRVLRALHEAGVILHGDAATREHVAGLHIREATEHDWATEYLDLEMAVRVVDSVEEAVEHINRYGSGHSEAIVTGSTATKRIFELEVDAGCIYVNASTRFSDGGEFGMGAEIGSSTQKLHARGPLGVRELCTFKYLVEGSGHVRI
jgi:glutamate-5-semialdehyde dehydrogenase